MLREIRRFKVKDGQGRVFTICEVQTVRVVDGMDVPDGAPTLFTAAGFEVVQTDKPGEYLIGPSAIKLRVVDGSVG